MKVHPENDVAPIDVVETGNTQEKPGVDWQKQRKSSKWYNGFAEELPSMKGKLVVITGCTSGTGFVAAGTLARNGAHVVMLNRPSERAEKALTYLKSQFPNSKIDHVDCDLSKFSSVRSAAQTIHSNYDSIYGLLNNAGVMALPDEATADGYDIQMQTNHLSHFLLTKLLLPLLEKEAEKTGEARVVNHSSVKRIGKPLEKDYFGKNGGKLGGDSQAARWERYHQTKLANAVFTYALKDKLDQKKSKVKAVVCHPGVSKTPLFEGIGKQKNRRRSSLYGKIAKGIVFNFVAQDVADGTMGILFSTCLGVKSGDFIGPGAEGYSGPVDTFDPEPYCCDQESKTLLWEESEKAITEYSHALLPYLKITVSQEKSITSSSSKESESDNQNIENENVGTSEHNGAKTIENEKEMEEAIS